MKTKSIEGIDVVITVLKQSETGIFRNQRLLLIKSGYLSYFSKIPKHYVGNIRSIELSGELPKMTLCASDVQSIERRRKYLHIKFNKKNLISAVKLKKLVDGQADSKNSKADENHKDENIEWVFKCENV